VNAKIQVEKISLSIQTSPTAAEADMASCLLLLIHFLSSGVD
jgi:hypothetical protein